MLVVWLGVLAVPDYEFICHPCKLVWEKEYSMKNAPARSRCPECSKLSHQNWSNKQTAVHFIGEFHTNKRLAEKSKTNESDLKKYGQALFYGPNEKNVIPVVLIGKASKTNNFIVNLNGNFCNSNIFIIW